MIDVAMGNGDLIINRFGDIALEFTEEDDIIQMANSAISTIKGENIFHEDYGNDALNQRLKMSRSGLDIVESCAKDAILVDDRIDEVTSINAYMGDNGVCIIDYTLLTIDGVTVSSRSNINIL